jgi:hypothetical protein
MRRELSESDVVAVMAYVGGDMTEAEQLAFERRLAADAQLARTVESCLDLDGLLSARPWPARTSEPAAVLRSPWAARLRRWAPALAAVALVALGLRLFWPGVGSPATARIGLLPSHATLAEFSQSHEELRGLKPPASDDLRGGPGTKANVTAEEYLAKAKPLEEAAARRAFEPQASELSATFFQIVLELPESSHVLVVGLPDVGVPIQLHPPPDGVRGARSRAVPSQPADGLLGPGTVFLPSPALALVGEIEAAVVEFAPGFSIPLGADTLDVVVGVREKPLDEGETQALRDWLSVPPADVRVRAPELERRLKEWGIHVLRRRVRVRAGN